MGKEQAERAVESGLRRLHIVTGLQSKESGSSPWRLRRSLDADIAPVSTPSWKFAIFAELEVSHPRPISLPLVFPPPLMSAAGSM